MPTTIRVMSWNIESLGEEKGTRPGPPPVKSQLITYICRVTYLLNADVIGIMELKGAQGRQVSQWLIAKLNGLRPNNAAYRWRCRVSSRQDGGTQEECILAWKSEGNRLVLDPNGNPGPTALVGVVDDNVLETFIAAKNWNPQATATFYDSLEANEYIDHPRFKDRSKMVYAKTWRVDGDEWDDLNQMTTPEVTFDPSVLPHPPAGITQQDKQDLAEMLLTIDILKFVSPRDRSPYLANFLVGNAARPLMIALLHAPGPSEPARFPAINNMALIDPFQDPAATPNLLVMGDFNIAATQMGQTARVWDRYTKGGHFGFYEVTPVQTQQIFVPLTSPPVGLTMLALAPDDRTSLTNAYEPDTALPGDVLNNTFDKFLLRGPVAQNPECVNLAQRSAANQPGFNPGLGRSLLSFFRYYRGAVFLTKQHGQLVKKKTKAEREYKSADRAFLNAQAKENAAKKSKTWTKTCAVAKRVTLTRAKRGLTLQNFTGLTRQVNALDNLITLEANNMALTATGMGTGAAIYRYGVSDHLPIITGLRFP